MGDLVCQEVSLHYRISLYTLRFFRRRCIVYRVTGESDTVVDSVIDGYNFRNGVTVTVYVSHL